MPSVSLYTALPSITSPSASKGRDFRCTLYADDFSLSYASFRFDVAERHIQLALGRVTHWADSHGFKFSPTKTVAMLFSRSRGEFKDPDLFLYDRKLLVVEMTRFLGLILDKRLTWLPHLQDLKAVCQRRMSLLRFLSHVSWGADRTILFCLYHSFILSKLDYGSQVYASATSPRLRTLDSVHHGGIRLATGAFRSCPIPSLLVDAGVLPLDLHRQTQIARLRWNLTMVMCRRARRMDLFSFLLVAFSQSFAGL